MHDNVVHVVWCMLCGACCVVHVVWYMLCGACCVVHVVWCLLCGACCVVQCTVYNSTIPRHAPETIAAAQLYALQQGDLATAARFDARNHHTATPTSHQPSDDDALFTSMLSWRRLLVHPIYAVLGDADADVRWGPSAMVGPAEAVLECTVRETGFVWRMGLGGDGCWRVLDVMVAQLGLGNEGVEVM